MHNQKVLSDKPNKTDIDNWNCWNKDISSLSGSCLTKSIIYQANIVTSLIINKSVTLDPVKQDLRNAPERSRITWLYTYVQ